MATKDNVQEARAHAGDYRYLLRRSDGTLYQTPEFRVGRIEINRKVGKPTPVKGLGMSFQHVEGTGRYRTDVATVMSGDGTYINHWGAYGNHGIPNGAPYATLTAAGVKTTLRRIRDQEATQLQAVGDEIADLEVRLVAARRLYRATLREAWGKANVVRLQEVQGRMGQSSKSGAES